MQIKYKNDICSKCGEDKLIVHKSKKLCQYCLNALKTKQQIEKQKNKPKKNYVIPSKSSTLKEKEKEYNKLARQYKKEHPICECIGCNNPTSDIHHKKGRGIYLCAVEFFLGVCRTCHRKIEENPIWSKEMGYSVSRLK